MKHLNILLVNNKSKTINKLIELLNIYGQVNLIEFDSLKKESTENYDLVVLSGSSQLYALYDTSKFVDELNLIRNSNTPIIGICFGFEIICLSFNSEIKQLNEEADDFRVIKLAEYFSGINYPVVVKEKHGWAITKTGIELEVLGTSKSGVEIIKHKTKNIFGFQFHPELFTDLTQGDSVLDFVLKKIFK